MTPAQLKKWRTDNKMTQVQAAASIYKSLRQYQNLESGATPISEETAELIKLRKEISDDRHQD